jgi:hypothetical protein
MKKPNEIFTHSIGSDAAKNIRDTKNYICEFTGKECIKQSRTIDYPMGVCSVNFNDNKPIICPNRFLEAETVFRNIAKSAFGSIDNVLVFSEIGLKAVGNFDFVLVKHRPISSEVEDFCIVEFQSDATTGTGKLVNALKDFMGGVMGDNYAFGMNTYNTIKLSYIQMLMKGQVMESWDKKIFWVMQKYVFNNMTARFNLDQMEFDNEKNTQYHIYDLNKRNNLELVSTKSTSVGNLITAFTNQPVPSQEQFIQKLEDKIKLSEYLSVDL